MPRFTPRTLTPLALCLLLTAAPATAQEASPRVRVELEVVTQPGLAVTAQQKWLPFLSDVELDRVRIRSGRAGEQAKLETRETAGIVTHHVVGLLTNRDRLQVPGGSFRYGDRTGIEAWVEKLRRGGEEGARARNTVFGLTRKQLVDLHEQLATQVEFSTRGEPAAEVVDRIVGGLPVRVVIDPAARRTLAADPAVRDELRGLGSGSALAAAVRPLGLVVVPHRAGNAETVLRIRDVRDVTESWPIGWPSPKSAGNTLPQLFKRLNVEIGEIPLQQAVDAIQQRLEVPVLWDHNSLAREGIDAAKARVALPAQNLYYKEILDQLLRQAELKSELRVDEAGRPFLWISPR